MVTFRELVITFIISKSLYYTSLCRSVVFSVVFTSFAGNLQYKKTGPLLMNMGEIERQSH